MKSGESTLREAYAYMLDHDGFAGVPPTCLVELSHDSLPGSPIDESQFVSTEFSDLISGLLKLKK